MRQLVVGAALLVGALVVTFATANILQGMHEKKRPIVAEPSMLEKTAPAATATRAPRAEPGRSVIVPGRHAQM